MDENKKAIIATVRAIQESFYKITADVETLADLIEQELNIKKSS